MNASVDDLSKLSNMKKHVTVLCIYLRQYGISTGGTRSFFITWRFGIMSQLLGKTWSTGRTGETPWAAKRESWKL